MTDPLRYMTGFGGHFESEAVEGALPKGRNSPQRPAFGLYAEQVSGTSFTAPRHENRRSWLYRMRPTADHAPFAAYNGARNGAELGALLLGGIVVGALGARAALLAAGLGPALIGTGCLLLLITRRRDAAALTTTEGRVVHAHVQR